MSVNAKSGRILLKPPVRLLMLILMFAALALLATASPPFSTPAHAANLVPNPSFEANTGLPTGYAQLSLATPWFSPTNTSPDYYHSPTDPNGVGVPVNLQGSQLARTGQAYAGLILRDPGDSWREYIETPLSSPLVAGTIYQVSFYVSLSDESKWAVDQLGAYFSIGQVGPTNNWAHLTFAAQVSNPPGNILTDKIGWIHVSGTYVAAGLEDHLMIGNFNIYPTNVASGQGGTNSLAYYYLDDVSVEIVEPGSITICKHTDPPGGTGFSFGWSAPNIRTVPFTLDDGGPCFTMPANPADGPYGFSELSPPPAGWVLSDIVCTGGANVQIGSNSVFDQGDAGVTIDLSSGENVNCTFTNGPALCNADTPGFTVIQNISTGQSGGPVTLDQSWSRGPNLYGPVYSTTPATVPLWTTAPSGSRWINYYAPPSLGVVYAPPGQYVFQTSFYVNTTLYYGLELEFQWAADNNASIDLNSSNIASGSASFSALSNAVLATPTSTPALIANQTNTLTAYVDNISTGLSPTGLLVKGKLTGCLKQPVGPTKPSCITIIKDAVPNDPQDFNFTWNGPSFILDDDPSSSTHNSITNCDLGTGGIYTITETPIPAPWSLTNISCWQSPSPWATVFIGPATPATFSPGDNSVTITLPSPLPGSASVTCVFTNLKLPQGCVTIVKDRLPNSPEDFNFTWNGGVTPIVLDDDPSSTTPNSLTNCDLTIGFPITVKELGPVPTTQVSLTALVGIVCTVSPLSFATVQYLSSGSFTSYQLGDDSVKITLLTNSGNVTCTFVNSPNLSGLSVDSDCDGDVTARDALNGLRYVAGLNVGHEEGCPPPGSTVVAVADNLEVWGDRNCDGKVDAMDTLWALQELVQLPIDLGLECK